MIREKKINPIAYFVDKYMEKMRFGYSRVSGKEAGLMKRIKEEYGEETLLKMIDSFFENSLILKLQYGMKGSPTITAFYWWREKIHQFMMEEKCE